MDASALVSALRGAREDLPCSDRVLAIAEEALAEARKRYGALEVGAPELARKIAQSIDSECPSLEAALDGLAIADLWFATSVGAGDDAALKVFGPILESVFDQVESSIRGAANHRHELRSRVMVRVLGPRGPRDQSSAPAIAGYLGRCSLRGWLRVVSVREAFKLIRTGVRDPLSSDEMLERIVAPEVGADLRYMKELYRDRVREAFAAALASLEPRERTLIGQHVLDELTFDQMAPLHGVGRSTIGRWLAKARDRLASETRRQIGERLDVPKSEVDSILRLVESQLDITLGPLRPSA